MVNGWIPTSLGDILSQERRPVVLDPEKKYAEIGIYSYGRGIFHKEPRTGFEVGNKDLYEIKQGDFIFQITFAWEGAIALASEAEDGMYGSVRFPTYRVNENICDPKFLLQYFKTEDGRREVGRISPGSAGRNRVLATKRLPEIFVSLPPLTEQRRIVAHIESLAARVNEAQSLREEADVETDIFINTFLNKLVSDLEQKHKTVFLEELLTDSNYGTSVKCHPERTNDAIPVLRIPNVASEKVTLNDLKYGVLSEAEFNKTVLSEGDILVVRTNGSKDLVGRCAVVPELPEPMAFASYMIRIRSNKEIISPEFLQLVLRQQRTGGYLIDFARTTAGQYNVSLGRLKNTKIPVPPLDEQRRIVAYLDGLQAKVNALRGLQSQSQEELDALLPSVLDRAFKGGL